MEKKTEAVRGHILFAVAVFLLLALCYKIARELEIIYVSALFAVVLMPAVRKITTLNLRGYRPSSAVAIILLLLATIVAAAVLFHRRRSPGPARSPQLPHRASAPYPGRGQRHQASPHRR